MIIRDIASVKSLMLVILLLVSTIFYFQFTVSELIKERRGERIVLMSLRWIVFCFITSILLLWALPFLFVTDAFLHSIIKDLPLFFTLSFLHIIVVSIFIILGTLPLFLARRRAARKRALFRTVEFGYVLYLTLIAGSGFLGEIRVGLTFSFKEIIENRWGIIELLAIMLPLYCGISVIIMLVWKYTMKTWEKNFKIENYEQM